MYGGEYKVYYSGCRSWAMLDKMNFWQLKMSNVFSVCALGASSSAISMHNFRVSVFSDSVYVGA